MHEQSFSRARHIQLNCPLVEGLLLAGTATKSNAEDALVMSFDGLTITD